MPSNKKKHSKKKKDDRRIKREADHSVKEHADDFRQLLLTARQDYSKGRSYDAVKTQRQSLLFGSDKLPRFDDNSLVKAHVLVELGLALSAVMTDFAKGEEWQKAKEDCQNSFFDAIKIFEQRLVVGKPIRFRSDECWISGDAYCSPVPHTERMGPNDYMTCANLAVGFQDPSPQTVQTLTKAILFGKNFRSNQCLLQLDGGISLSGEMPPVLIDQLSVTLREHKAILAGEMKGESRFNNRNLTHAEVRHTGSRLGTMKNSDKKLVKDIAKKGQRKCANIDCSETESYPMQFSTCSRCKWASYCSRECQATDWKRHKRECKTEAVQERAAYKDQNKDESSLQYGQTQHIIIVIRYLHHFAALSEEMMSTQTVETERLKTIVLPSLNSAEIGTIQLGIKNVSFVWDALWSMKQSDRTSMIQRFLSKEVQKFGFRSKFKGGPDFSVISDWGSKAIADDFYVVKYTPKGSILLHDERSTNGVIKAYLVIGLSQSIQAMVESMNTPLPVHIHTAILPYKKLIMSQGTITPPFRFPVESFKLAANSYAKGQVEMDVLTTL